MNGKLAREGKKNEKRRSWKWKEGCPAAPQLNAFSPCAGEMTSQPHFLSTLAKGAHSFFRFHHSPFPPIVSNPGIILHLVNASNLPLLETDGRTLAVVMPCTAAPQDFLHSCSGSPQVEP